MRTGDLAPDHPDVGAADLALGPVDKSDLLALVEVGGLGVVNTLDLDQTVLSAFPLFSSDSDIQVDRTSCWGGQCACCAGSSGGGPCID